jgi:hypothetical protein
LEKSGRPEDGKPGRQRDGKIVRGSELKMHEPKQALQKDNFKDNYTC